MTTTARARFEQAERKRDWIQRLCEDRAHAAIDLTFALRECREQLALTLDGRGDPERARLALDKASQAEREHKRADEIYLDALTGKLDVPTGF